MADLSSNVVEITRRKCNSKEMSVFTQASERIPGVNITLGESVNIPTARLTRQHRAKHVRSVSEATKLPPAVAAVPADHIRGYVHSKRVNSYLVGSTLGEGSFAKVKEGFHVLVGEKVSNEAIILLTIILSRVAVRRYFYKVGGAHYHKVNKQRMQPCFIMGSSAYVYAAPWSTISASFS